MPNTILQITAGTELLEPGFVQMREWMLYRIREDHYPLNIMVDFTLDSFDHAIFQKTINLLVQRHEIFRTTLQVIRGNLKQVIHEAGQFEVSFSFFNGLKYQLAEREVLIRNKMLLLFSAPFNFEYGPVFRIAVFKKQEDEFHIVFVFHHLIFDNVSADIFKADATRIWISLTSGIKMPLADPPQYRLYTAFEQQLLNTNAGQSHRLYWTRQLEQPFPVLGLVEQHAWKAYQSRKLKNTLEAKRRVLGLPAHDQRFLGSVARRYKKEKAGVVHFGYTVQTVTRIFEYKKNNNNNLHSLFIAAFLMALNRLSGQELFVFDIPASRRTDGVFKQVIGWLAAGGVCYFDMTACVNPRVWVQYIDRQLFNLAKHCVYPFEVLDFQSELPIGCTVPVFFTVSEVDRYMGNDQKSGVIKHDPEGEAGYEQMAVFLSVYNDTCYLELIYNNSIFPPGIMEKLVLEQETCLNALLAEIL